MKGEIVHNWIVLERDYTKSGKGAYWICQCQCDKRTIKSISGINLRSGSSKSCGCEHKNYKVNKIDINEDYGIGYTEKGEIFYFDVEDYEYIKKYYWYINSSGYPCTRRNGKDIFMHRLIMKVEKGAYIDHINHKTMDNRKVNLRVVSHDKNMLNKNTYKNNTSGYKGVNWNKRDEKWIARISINKKEFELGRFTNIEDAIAIRKEAEIKYYGEYRNKIN